MGGADRAQCLWDRAVTGLTQEKALIFRITHIANVPWILEHGIRCVNSGVRDPNFRNIGNADLISKRARRGVPIPPGGTLSDYVPFYFTPHSPMLLNIKTGYNGMQQTPMSEIAVLVSSLRTVAERGLPFVMTDRHAYLKTAQYSNTLDGLDRIDWRILQERDFKRDPADLGKVERYQAEALVHDSVPVEALMGLACYGRDQEAAMTDEVTRRRLSLKVLVRPGWYF